MSMEELQIFDMDSVTMRTDDFSIATIEPYLGGCHAQVSDTALGPAVNCSLCVATSLTDRCKSLVGLHLDMSRIGFGCNALIDNFDSTKGEIGCYSGYGHRRPPVDIVYLAR